MSFNLGIGGGPATPNISATLIMVNKNGEVAVNTGLFEKGLGTRYMGEKVAMLRKGGVDLNEKSVSSYCKAIEESSFGMKANLVKAFSKIKK